MNTTKSEGQRSVDTILRNVPEVPVMRRTEPSTHLYQGKVYVPSDKMDVRVPVAQFTLFGVKA